MSEYGALAKSSAINISAQISAKFLSFLYMIFISRIISQSEIGLFYLAMGVISIFAVFADLGMSSSLVRYVPFLSGRKEYEKLIIAIKTTFKFGLSFGFILSIIVFIFSKPIALLINRPEVEPILKILAAAIFIRKLGGISANLLLTRKKVIIFSAYQVVNVLIKIIAVFLLIYLLGPTAATLSWSYLLAFILVVLILLYFVLKEYSKISKEAKHEKQITKNERNAFIKEYITFGLFSIGIFAISVVMGSTDKILLSVFGVSNADIGIYALVFNLIAAFAFIPGSITSMLFPQVSEMFGKKRISEMRSITIFSSKLISIILIPVFAVLLLFPSNFIGLIYGNSYTSGWLILVILVLGAFVRHIVSPAGNGLGAMRRLDIDFKVLLGATIVNIIIDVLLIPPLGVVGAAIGTAVSYVSIALSILYFSNKLFKFNLSKHTLSILLSGIIVFVVMYPLAPIMYNYLQNAILSIHWSTNPIFIIIRKTLQLSVYAIIGFIFFGLFAIMLILFKIFSKTEYDLLSSLLIRVRAPAKIRNYILKIMNYGVSGD